MKKRMFAWLVGAYGFRGWTIRGHGRRLETAPREFRALLGGGEGKGVAPGVAEVDRRLLDHVAVCEHSRPGHAAPFVAEFPGVEGAAVDLDQRLADAVLELPEVAGDGLGVGFDRHGVGMSASASPTAPAKPASVSSSCARDRKPTSYAEGASM